MFLMNIPLALLGFKFLNRKFSIFAIISAFTFSFFVYITRTLNDVKFLEDILLCSLFGGLLNGVAMGFLFRNDLCQGGIDFLTKIHLRAGRQVQARLDDAVVAQRDPQAGVGPQQAALAQGDPLAPAAREHAHRRGAAADVGPVPIEDRKSVV